MNIFTTFVALSAFASTLAYPLDDYNIRATDGGLVKRAEAGVVDWHYAESDTWGSIKSEYSSCQIGTHQAPIDLPSHTSHSRAPTFNYIRPVAGKLINSGHGPSFTLNMTNGKDYTSNPSLTFDGKTVYLKQFHTHTPSEHTVDGVAARGELHLVHVDAEGHNAAVASFRLNPNLESPSTPSPFFSQFIPQVPSFDSSAQVAMDGFKIASAVAEVGNFRKYWTYSGSLTTPPCSEGLTWFVAARELLLSQEQMVALLGVSTYSARPTQAIWNHDLK